jgi:hypothetical protein
LGSSAEGHDLFEIEEFKKTTLTTIKGERINENNL